MTARAIESLELSANGLAFSALSCGDGPLALCAHGFPETAATFDRTLVALAHLGFRGVAPNLRGYWPSSVAGVERFHVNAIAEDLLAIGDALSPNAPFVLVGHDWGAFATYRAAAKIRANDFAGVDELYARWSPAWNVDASETAPVKAAFSHEGSLEAALSYYRHFVKQTRDEARRSKELDARPVRVPATIVLGLADGAITRKRVHHRPELFERGVETVWIEGAGHFLHREKPDEWIALLRRVLPAP